MKLFKGILLFKNNKLIAINLEEYDREHSKFRFDENDIYKFSESEKDKVKHIGLLTKAEDIESAYKKLMDLYVRESDSKQNN